MKTFVLVLTGLISVGTGSLQGQPEEALTTGILNARAMTVRGEGDRLFKLSGWVTFVNPKTGLGFLQDRSGGMAFRVSPKPEQAPGLGDRVSVTGFVVKHDRMLMLSGTRLAADGAPTVARFEKTSDAKPPSALQQEFDLTQAAYMQVHAEMVHFRAIVRRVMPPPEPGGYWRVEVSSRTAKGIALLPWRISSEAHERWKDREVDVIGVVASSA